MDKDKRLQTLCLLLMAAAMYSKNKEQDRTAGLSPASPLGKGESLEANDRDRRP